MGADVTISGTSRLDLNRPNARYHYVNLLQASGMTEGLHKLSRSSGHDDGAQAGSSDARTHLGDTIPVPTEDANGEQSFVSGPADPEAERAVKAAIEIVGGSLRPGVPGRLDAMEKYVSREHQVGAGARTKPEKMTEEERVRFLGNTERIRAIKAILLIAAQQPEWITAKQDKFEQIVHTAVDIPTVDDVHPKRKSAQKRAKDDWIRSWRLRPYWTGILTRPEKERLDNEYKARQRNAWQAVQQLQRHVQNTGVDGLDRAYELLSPEDKHSVREHLSGVVGGASYCNEEPIPQTDSKGDAIRINAGYTSDRPPEHFIFPANPLNWHKLSPSGFFKDITPQDDLLDMGLDLHDPRHAGFQATILERVDLGDPYVETGLTVNFFVAPAQGPVKGDEVFRWWALNNPYNAKALADRNPGAEFVGVTYDIVKGVGDGNIDVDHGYLHVQRTPDGGSRVTSSKTVRFTADSGIENALGTWACLIGWVEAMRRMNSWWLK